ncbi:acetate--CoA ligase [Patescibacteria group bacterium]
MATNYVEKQGDKFVPSAEMKKSAWISDEKIYQEASTDPIKFWEKQATEGLKWHENWKTAYEEKLPYFKWFVGGKLNFCENVLDRHIEAGKGEKTALIWVPEPEEEEPIKLTYNELFNKVNRFANVLKKYGVKRGDVVAIYLPLIPEAAVAMLACTRIGAIHSVVFSAFSAEALKARIDDGKAKILVTSDGYWRRGEKENLIDKAREAALDTSVQKVIVVSRLGEKFEEENYLDFETEIKQADENCDLEIMNSEDTMFILYTSGTTGKPKGVVHDTGGYAVQAYITSKWNFNLHDNDIMWCTADIGWITGHTYAIYGPLLNGCTTFIFEGSPDFPDAGRWWKEIEEHKITVFYTAPTAIRMFMKAGDEWIKKYNLDSLKILGTVGEPIDEDAWNWYFETIGGSRCPVIDTWWQTETGGTLINALPGIGPFVPTIAGKSFPGTKHLIVDEEGEEVKEGVIGNLVQLSPFAPGLLHGVYKNPKKYQETYWDRFKTKYYDTSDGAYIKDGLIRITGRTDDVMKVAGHRLATAELENAIAEDDQVNECAVVPIPHEVKGEVPVAFVVMQSGEPNEDLVKQIKADADRKIGPTARPAKVYFVEDLPKTRSGKIMRRILKSILKNEEPEGLMTLVNPEAVEKIKQIISEKEPKSA